MNQLKHYFVIVLINLNLPCLIAQTPTIQDCLGAIPICQQIYTETLSPSGTGNYFEISGNNTCATSETNSIWYTFTTNQSGEFGFVITPNNSSDDYDWWLFDISNAGCEGINDQPITASCNVAGGGSCDGVTGANGATGYRMQGPGCGALIPDAFAGRSAFNGLVMVEQGNTYALCISNWTGSPFGYEIDFGLSGDIGILDETLPEISELNFPTACAESQIEIHFSEYIQCATITESNFQLEGPGSSYSLSLNSNNCAAGGNYERTFILTIDPPIQSLGNFTLIMTTNGSTEVLDLCDNPAEPAHFDFTVSEALPSLPIDIGSDTALLCVGEVLVLDATFDAAVYEWQDGSSEATYQVIESGLYSVMINNPCGTGFDTIEVTYLNEAPQVFFGNDTILCEGDLFILDATNEFATYLWQDGSTAATFQVQTTGQYAVTVTNACGEITDHQTATFIPTIAVDLGVDTVLCPGDHLVLNAFSAAATAYLWNDQSSKAEKMVIEPGLHSVTVSNVCQTVQDEILITECEKCMAYFPNAFSPNDDGMNDTFRPFSNCDLNDFHLQIFDRWGSLVFESFDENEGWDGRFDEKLAATGVYVWVMNFAVVEDFNERKVEERGDVLLIR